MAPQAENYFSKQEEIDYQYYSTILVYTEKFRFFEENPQCIDCYNMKKKKPVRIIVRGSLDDNFNLKIIVIYMLCVDSTILG